MPSPKNIHRIRDKNTHDKQLPSGPTSSEEMHGKSQRPSDEAEIIVIGGGPAGLTLTALLAAQGISVICLDKESGDLHLTESYDGRTTALSYGSRNVLTHCQVWDKLEPMACPINDIRILDGTSPVLMRFLSEEMAGKIFGWIVENKDMRQLLFQYLAEAGHVLHATGAAVRSITIHDDSVCVETTQEKRYKGRLLIGADGRASFTRNILGIPTRQWTYAQTAHVSTLYHRHPHHNVAYEHFREEGPFAILPMADSPDGRFRSAVVWSEHHGPSYTRPATSYVRRKETASPPGLTTFTDEQFLAAMQARFPDHYGELSLSGYRAAYPLGLLHARKYTGARTALVAEAAHAMHPIAGQGLNMSLRDVATLTELLVNARTSGADIGNPLLLADYERKRRLDNTLMLAATDALVRLYSNRLPPVRLARKAGVKAIGALPPAKRFFMAQAMGLNGRLSHFIRTPYHTYVN